MTEAQILKNESGKTIKVNFESFDKIISKFDSDISFLSESKNYIVENIINLEECFSVDTFCNIKEVLNNLNLGINKIAEYLSIFNYQIRQTKAYYEKLANLYNTNVNQNKSMSNGNDDIEGQTNSELFGDTKLQYNDAYNVTDDYLTRDKGVVYYNGHKETWYSEKVLPGEGLNIPGRHVAADGTIRDIDGYIVVASDLSYLSRGSTLMTSLGPAKVYDTGCAYGTIDIYVNW